MPCGQGTLIKEDGEGYEGEWWCGVRHGGGKATLGGGKATLGGGGGGGGAAEGEWRCGRPWNTTGSVEMACSKEGKVHGAGCVPAVFTGTIVNGERVNEGAQDGASAAYIFS